MTPNDTMIGPIVAQLIAVTQQIAGIGTCYDKAPDSPPEDNSVIFPCKRWQVDSMTNGRIRMRLTFDIAHLFRRRRLDELLPDMQAFVPAWWTVLSAWKNQTLGGLVKSLDIQDGGISTLTYAKQQYLALTHTVTVLAEFLIDTTSI